MNSSTFTYVGATQTGDIIAIVMNAPQVGVTCLENVPFSHLCKSTVWVVGALHLSSVGD